MPDKPLLPAFTTLGANTKTVFLHTENHKTTVQFPAGSATMYAGQPVKLDAATGNILPMGAADLEHLCIGFVYNPPKAVGDLVTVWTRGYAIILVMNDAAIQAGPVKFKAYDTTTAIAGNTGFNVFVAATDGTDTIGWCLDVQSTANNTVRVLMKD